jgi:hypothetical protein
MRAQAGATVPQWAPVGACHLGFKKLPCPQASGGGGPAAALPSPRLAGSLLAPETVFPHARASGYVFLISGQIGIPEIPAGQIGAERDRDREFRGLSTSNLRACLVYRHRHHCRPNRDSCDPTKESRQHNKCSELCRSKLPLCSNAGSVLHFSMRRGNVNCTANCENIAPLQCHQ